MAAGANSRCGMSNISTKTKTLVRSINEIWLISTAYAVGLLFDHLPTIYHAPWYWKEREVMIASLLCRNKNLESASGHHPLFAQEKAGGSRLPALIQKTYTFMFFSCSLFLQQCVFCWCTVCACVCVLFRTATHQISILQMFWMQR